MSTEHHYVDLEAVSTILAQLRAKCARMDDERTRAGALAALREVDKRIHLLPKISTLDIERSGVVVHEENVSMRRGGG